MHLLSRLFVFIALVALNVPSQAMASGESRVKCETKKFSGRATRWCHDWDEGASTKQVIYYFHGIGGTEKSWEDTAIRQALRLE
ncbi:MAG: hypothetical protein ACXWQO_07165, partial [Bdellovibrionota bacterium]